MHHHLDSNFRILVDIVLALGRKKQVVGKANTHNEITATIHPKTNISNDISR